MGLIFASFANFAIFAKLSPHKLT